MKKILCILLSLVVALCAKGQGRPYGGPIGNPVERFALPECMNIEKTFFSPLALLQAALVKVGEGKDSSYMFCIWEERGMSGKTPVFSCSLGERVYEPVLAEIGGKVVLYFRTDETKKSWIHIMVPILFIKELPTMSAAFYNAFLIFSAIRSASPSL